LNNIFLFSFGSFYSSKNFQHKRRKKRKRKNSIYLDAMLSRLGAVILHCIFARLAFRVFYCDYFCVLLIFLVLLSCYSFLINPSNNLKVRMSKKMNTKLKINGSQIIFSNFVNFYEIKFGLEVKAKISSTKKMSAKSLIYHSSFTWQKITRRNYFLS
jgi:hypothetical protein